MKLQMSSRQSGDTLVIVLEGELTMTETAEFRTWITEQLADGPTQVEVDCKDLAYIDSTGLGALVFLRKSVLAGGGRLCLTKVSGWLKKFLQVTGLERTFVAPAETASNEAATEPTPEEQV